MSRTEDAKVAELVFGWQDIVGVAGNSPEGYREIIPEYTADAAADYTVLCEVREKWGGTDQYERFCRTLGKMLRDRTGQTEDRWLYEIMLMPAMYQPGDYSRAALRVLENAKVGV